MLAVVECCTYVMLLSMQLSKKKLKDFASFNLCIYFSQINKNVKRTKEKALFIIQKLKDFGEAPGAGAGPGVKLAGI